VPPKKKSTADLALAARDLIEQINCDVLDEPGKMTAPRIHETTRALMSLMDRLPQAFDQLATVLEMRAKDGAIVMDTADDPDVAATTTAEELRAAAADAQALAHQLAVPTRTLYSMGHKS